MVVAGEKAVAMAREMIPKKAERRVSVESEPGRA